jgi:hypothetical protein
VRGVTVRVICASGTGYAELGTQSSVLRTKSKAESLPVVRRTRYWKLNAKNGERAGKSEPRQLVGALERANMVTSPPCLGLHLMLGPD